MSEHRDGPPASRQASPAAFGTRPVEPGDPSDLELRAAFEALAECFPPTKAMAAEGKHCFRLVRSDPPTVADVVPHCLEPGFDRLRWQAADGAAAVSYTGLSVLNTQARASKLRRGIPALQDRLVAAAELPSGLTKTISSGHHVWWPQPSITWYWEVDRNTVADCFAVVPEER